MYGYPDVAKGAEPAIFGIPQSIPYTSIRRSRSTDLDTAVPCRDNGAQTGNESRTLKTDKRVKN